MPTPFVEFLGASDVSDRFGVSFRCPECNQEFRHDLWITHRYRLDDPTANPSIPFSDLARAEEGLRRLFTRHQREVHNR